LILTSILALSGCTTKAKDPIVGTWQADDIAGMTLTFTDQNSTLDTNGTARLSWNGSVIDGGWKSLGNDTYSALFTQSDLQDILNVRMIYNRGALYTSIGGVSVFHR